ncbi:neurotrypsin-like [Acanthaster planci]|uniref:Neurotrypsin-like n=1 Tax=Acanthaster planci TaxID=133434 RepID=A0A8B7Y2X5_ACAPL|nr:neurotrypsin-like [Acanthaster planci]
MMASPYIGAVLVVIVLAGLSFASPVNRAPTPDGGMSAPCVSGPLGMESGAIKDSSITASSSRSSHPASDARLNTGYVGWTPRNPFNQWIKVALGSHVAVTGVVIQGHGNGDTGYRYVTAFKAQYRVSHESDWQDLRNADGGKLFRVSSGRPTNVTFSVATMARYLRVQPWSYTEEPYSVRFEVLGCQVSDGSLWFVDGDDALSGRVEIYHQATSTWGAVCSDGWDLSDANIACRQHHRFLEAVQAGEISAGTDHPIVMNGVACKGTENRLIDCPFICTEFQQCNSSRVATLACRTKMNTVRLVGGSNNSSGRVEIYRKDTWGSICDNGWDMNDAAVVCRFLGFSGAQAAKSGAYFGEGSGPVHMDGVACTGAEDTLRDCPSACWEESQCSHSQDAGVICQD